MDENAGFGNFVEGVPDDFAKRLNARYMKRMMFLGFAGQKMDDESAGPSAGRLKISFGAGQHARYSELVEQRMTEQMDFERLAPMMYSLGIEKENAMKAGDVQRAKELEYRMSRLDDDHSYLWELFLENQMNVAAKKNDNDAVDRLMNEYQATMGKKIDFEAEFLMRDAYFKMKAAEKSEDYAALSEAKMALDTLYSPDMKLDPPLRGYFSQKPKV